TAIASSASMRTVDRGSGGPRIHIPDRRTLAPLRNGLGVEAQLPAQLRERSLRSLYCCSDSVRGRGASVTNLSHRASFHSKERIAPSNHGIKHLNQPANRAGSSSLPKPKNSQFSRR